MNSNRIVIISSRYLKENPNREVFLLERMRETGLDAELIFLGKKLSHFGYDHGGILGGKYVNFVNNKYMLSWYLKKYKLIVVDAWKDVLQFTPLFKRGNRLVVDYNSGGGFDHFNFPSDLSCFRGKALHHAFQERAKTNSWSISKRKISYTGGLMYEGSDRINGEIFADKYKVRSDEKVVVFFPKSIYLYHNKLKLWFPDNYQECHKWYLKTYRMAIKELQDIGYRVFVKLHPCAYNGYKTNKNRELTYWLDNFRNIDIPDPEDTISLYKRCLFGMTILSHASVDLAYFKKPMIYVESENAMQAESTKVYASDRITTLPSGPSDMWKSGSWNKSKNPWIKSWVGSYCTENSIKEVSSMYYNEVKKFDFSSFNREFWVSTDGNSSDRIISAIKELNT